MAFGRKFLHGVAQIIKEIKLEAALPRGTICWFYLDSAPAGWTVCDGNNGTPNLIGKYARGGYGDEKGTVLQSSLPNITGVFGGLNNWGLTGAFSNYSGTGTDDPGNNKTCYTARRIEFSAKNGSTSGVYGRNETYPNEVIPESVVLLPCMKL